MSENIRVLIVDDEVELKHALRVRLTSAGFSCEIAANGKEALSLVSRYQPRIIVTDLVMPDMNGYDLCRKLQEDEQTARIPVIVLTAVPQHAVLKQGQLPPSARVMHKPFDSKELVRVMRELLQPQES